MRTNFDITLKTLYTHCALAVLMPKQRCTFAYGASIFFFNELVNIDRFVPSLSQDKLIRVVLHGSDGFFMGGWGGGGTM